MNTYHGLQRSCHHRQRDRPTSLTKPSDTFCAAAQPLASTDANAYHQYNVLRSRNNNRMGRIRI